MSATSHSPVAAPLRLFLVEDSAVISENLIATLDEVVNVEVLGCARDEHTALEWLLAPDVDCALMIIDIFLASGTGLEVLRRARILRPNTRLVVLTNYATPEVRRRCAQLGADRVFDKSAELEQLLAYCESIARGEA